MALIDDLRNMENEIPPSHVPTVNELAQLVGAIIAYVEHGDTLLKASKDYQQLANLLGGVKDSPNGSSDKTESSASSAAASSSTVV